MNHSLRPAALASLTIILVATTACEDPTARERARIQTAIDAAAATLEAATFIAVDPEDEQFEPVRARVQGVLSALAQANGGEPGQQAAAAQIEAAAHRQLAAMDLSRARALEATQRGDLALLHGRIDTLTRLQALTESESSYTTEAERLQLETERERAAVEMASFQERMTSLDEPINERTLANSSDARDVEGLRTQSDELLRDSTTAGPADGYDDFAQSVTLRRQADLIEYEIAQREIELALDLQPEHTLASARAGQYAAMIELIQGTDASLAQNEQASAQRSVATAAVASELMAEIEGQLSTLDETRSGELDELYESAAAQLEQAASRAGSAASRATGEEAASAHLLSARAAEELGRLHSARARQLSAYGQALERLSAVTGADAGELRSRITDIAAQVEEQQQLATTFFRQASERLDQVQSRTLQSQLQAMRQDLADLAGREIEIAPLPAPAPPSGAPPATGGGGFDSAQALVAHLGSRDWGDPASFGAFFDLVHATTPQARSLVDAQKAMLAATDELVEALAAAWAGGSAAALQQGMSAGLSSSAIVDPTITASSPDRATMTFTTPSRPEPGRLDLVNVGGSWMIDGESVMASLTEVQGMSIDPGQLVDLVNAMASGYRDVATRIRAGEFASPDDAQAALMEAMMGPMQELMQGAGQ